ncbi:MAG: GatB/YqeY domain-containing protein [Candidatus Wildermuthbacteria bacterium]|nr:GatB/YqeY domain-containing protein [Candidatus Wildermuthbacteria bacterium]
MISKEALKEDLKAAMKAGDSVRVGVLRMALAALLVKEKEGASGAGVSSEVIQAVIATEAKKRRESAEVFEKGGRPELAEKEKQELAVLLTYLPAQLSEQEVMELAKEAIAKSGAKTPQDIGKVMALLAPQTRGKADGALVNTIVKGLLPDR